MKHQDGWEAFFFSFFPLSKVRSNSGPEKAVIRRSMVSVLICLTRVRNMYTEPKKKKKKWNKKKTESKGK